MPTVTLIPPREALKILTWVIDRTKDYDNDLYAVRGEHRVRISVFRDSRYGFVATCKLGGHVHRYNGHLPSDAFARLVESLRWVVSRLDYEKNMATHYAAKA